MGGVKSSIYPLDEKQTAIGAAQTCVSSPGIGQRLVAHQGPSFLFSVQMGERWRKRMSKRERERQTFIFHLTRHRDAS